MTDNVSKIENKFTGIVKANVCKSCEKLAVY